MLLYFESLCIKLHQSMTKIRIIVAIFVFLSFGFNAFSAEVFPARPLHEAIQILKERGKIESAELEEIVIRHSLTPGQKAAIEKILPHWNYVPAQGTSYPNAKALQTANGNGMEWHSEKMFHLVGLRGLMNTSERSRVLDVGCAYGYGVNLALNLGAEAVVGIDLEPKHLAVLVRNLPVEHLDRLQLGLGVFPDEFNFKSESFDLVMMGLVLHFMTPIQAADSLLLANKILRHDGVFVVSSKTVFGGDYGAYKDKLKELQSRVASGRKRALEMNQSESGAKQFVFPTFCPEISRRAPHPMDVKINQFNLEVAGFRIVHAGEMDIGFTQDGTPANVPKDSDQGETPTFFSIISMKSTQVARVEGCARCGKPAEKICSRCKGVRYCSQECQKKDWPSHRGGCSSKEKGDAKN